MALQAETSRNECPVIYLVVKKKGSNSILLKGRHYIKLLTKTNFPLKKKLLINQEGACMPTRFVFIYSFFYVQHFIY